MRLTAYHKLLCPVLIIYFLGGTGNLQAQTGERVTLSVENASLQTIFSTIEAQTTYRFVFTTEQLKDGKPVTLSVNKAPIEAVLKQCFQDQPVYFSLEEKFIIIHRKEKDNKIDPSNITGIVKNDKGDPVAGVTVSISGSDKGTITETDGSFNLNHVPAGVTLVFSGANVESNQVVVNSRQRLNVILKSKISLLDDVQIIGYGTTTQRMSTGDVGSVKSEMIAQQPVSNLLSALEGRVPGLIVNQSSGIPGSAISVQIMGQNSIASGNDPFYIVDGVPFTASIAPQVDASSINLSPFNSINPSDIESIDVLKDADATAIYGSRGSNGVILITTKKGKEGRTILNVNINSGIGEVDRTIKWLNTPQYLEMRNEGFANDGTSPGPHAYDVNGTWDTTRYTDWQKVLIGGKSYATNAQISFSGGNSNTQFLISGNYHRETTVFPGEFKDTRGGLHFNISHNSTDRKFALIFSGSFMNDQNKLPNGDFASYDFLTTPPNAPAVYDADGHLNWDNGKFSNPLAWTENKYNTTTDYLIGNINLSYAILPGLILRAGLGYTATWIDNLIVYPSTSSYSGFGRQPFSEFGNSTLNTLNVEPQLNYMRKLGQGKLDILVGGTIQQSKINGYAVNATGFTNDELMESIGNASSIYPINNTYTQYHYVALFGRINYQLLDKFIFNLTARRDGSSRFGPGKQFANFGAGGIAWIFSKEGIFKDHFAGLSFGKIRMSYGTTGNDQIGDYQYLSTYSSTYYSFQGNTGLVPTRLANNNYSWEINRKFETGLELGWMNDRILLNLVYYHNRCSNQLIGTPLPGITGFSSVQANFPAVVQNTGYEVVLNASIVKAKSFSWKSSLNLTIPKNELISYPGISNSNYVYQYRVGQPLSVILTYQVAGVDQQTGIYVFKDQVHGGTTVNPSFPEDLVAVPVTQQYYGGLSNDFTWKNWQLDIFFQYVRQKGINGLMPGYPALVPGQMYNQPVTVLGRWQHPGDISSVQKFTAGFGDAYNSYANAVSDLQIGDASYLRLKNISLSYSINSSWLKKMNFVACRFYLQAQNLITVSHFSGLDPENQYGTPPIRMITGGLQFTL